MEKETCKIFKIRIQEFMCFFQDIHKRFRTESHSEIVPRFNERFLLSLASCKACLVVDDELNILPISSHVKSLTALPTIEVSSFTPFVIS